MIGLICLKELMLTQSMVHVSVLFVITGTFRYQPKVFDGCHNLIQKAKSFDDVAIVSVKINDYRIHLLYMSKDEATNLLRNADLTEKVEHYKT